VVVFVLWVLFHVLALRVVVAVRVCFGRGVLVLFGWLACLLGLVMFECDEVCGFAGL
jgi:hypothetical protein